MTTISQFLFGTGAEKKVGTIAVGVMASGVPLELPYIGGGAAAVVGADAPAHGGPAQA
ncbi:hypothetical protein [Cupriavidus lacunae]|uniref:hypothetical protein n=1 Tax=Cupriavidus lacunae TaxID=2666307 RepID=UPI001374E800|nr:hypothetical protein [Cupriavidus lacunae]